MKRKCNNSVIQLFLSVSAVLLIFSAVTVRGQSIGPLSANFEGIGYTGKNPPDPSIAVGPNYVVEVVNSEFVVFDKSSSRTVAYSSNLADFFNDQSDNIYDCKVVFDQYSQRYVLLTLADNGSNTGYYLLAVSEGTDPNPSLWYKYKLDASIDGSQTSDLRADYPGLGYDQNCVYITSNQYTFPANGDAFQYAKIRILKKSQIYSGVTPTAPFTDFYDLEDADGTPSFTVKPVQQFGSASAYYLVDTKKNGGNSITLWRIDNPSSNPTLSIQATIAVTSYSVPPDAAQNYLSSISVKKVGTSTQDAMYRDGYVYASFTTGHDWGSGNVSAIQYEKINVNSNTAVIDAVYGSDGNYYYCPDIYADAYGDIALVFCESSSNQYPGVWWSYRLASDGAMRAAQLLQAGGGYYDYGDPSGVNAYGDFSGMCLDASNDDRVWFCGEWPRSDHSQWDTQIGSFQFPSVEFANSVGGSIAGGSLKINSAVTVGSGSSLRLGMGASNSELTLAQGSGNQDRFVNTNGISTAKHNNWDQAASSYLLSNNFTVSGTPGETETAYFDALNPATVTATSIDGANLTGMKLAFNDPWYMNATSPQGNNYAQAAFPISQTSSPMTGAYNQGTGGVFEFQGGPPSWNPPYYSVGFPTGQTISVGGTNHQLYLVNWTASGANIQNPNANQSGVEFTSSNATVTANVKATQLSNDPSAYSDNGQRKFVRTPNGFLHCVYSDGGHIWYEYSTDNGSTWHLGMNWLATGPYGPLDGTAGGKDPSIDYDPQTNNVVIVWQQKSSNGYYTIQYMTFWPDDYVQNTYSINSYGTLYTDGSDAYSSVNANPNIAVNATASGGTEFWVLSLEKYHWYITAGDTVFGGIDVLVLRRQWGAGPSPGSRHSIITEQYPG